MIIDFHAHIYPDHLAAGAVASVCERSSIRAYTDGTLGNLLRSMETSGIDISVVSNVATKPGQVQTIHPWLRGLQGAAIHPLATMHPERPADENTLRTLKAHGFKGFKLHPDYQGFFVDEERMYPFYEAAQAEGMFLLFHAGVDRGLPNPIHSTPERLARVHKDFPDLIMVAAHLGGEFVHEETERHLLGEDIYMDTSFVLQRMPLSIVERLMTNHSADRLLFGSDSPWTDQGQELTFLLSLPFLSEEAKIKITSLNAARLLGLS